MADVKPRPLRPSELGRLVPDARELAKGVRLVEAGKLSALARHGARLHAEAEPTERGQGAAALPWRVSLAIDDDPLAVRATCTCPAAVRGACKHAAALLVAWARTPDAFRVARTNPERRSRKHLALRDAPAAGALAERQQQGLARVVALVRDLGVTGATSVTPERAASVRALARDLRDAGLRRLSARTLELADLLQAPRGGAPYAETLVDLLLTARRIERHLATGAPLDDRHVEELIGKTWSSADRRPVADLDLLEYAFLVRTTSDAFVIRESRLVDLRSGGHFSERQVVPLAIVPRKDPKPSRAGAVHAGVVGSVYPGYPPTRIELADLGAAAPVDHDTLTRLLAVALPDVNTALLALREHRGDLVAPDVLPVAVRAPLLVSAGGRLRAVDGAGRVVRLPDDPAVDAWIGDAVQGARLAVLLGDLGVDGALPTLWPLAAVVERDGLLALLPALDAHDTHAARVAIGSGRRAGSATWLDDARAAGASPGMVALAEAREQLGEALLAGVGTLDGRRLEPCAKQLEALGLDAQVRALRAVAAQVDDGALAVALSGVVKLHHLLGVALVGLASATQVDRAALVAVPDHASLAIARPERWLDPSDVARGRIASTLDRHEAAVHLAHHVELLSADELATCIDALWADGGASVHVARGFVDARDVALAAAREAFGGDRYLVARMTALRVLAAAGGIDATAWLSEVAARGQSPALRALATELLGHRRERTRLDDATQTLRGARTRDVRRAAVRALVELEDRRGIPALRRGWVADASQEVRAAAAIGLAELGDVEIVPALVGALARRAVHEAGARTAASALGAMGDVRALAPLLDALGEGWNPTVVLDAIGALGARHAIEALLDRLEASPTLARDPTARGALARLVERLAATMITRLDARAGTPAAAKHGALYLDVTSLHPACRRDVAASLSAALPASSDPKLVEAARVAAR